jgi:cyanophycinase
MRYLALWLAALFLMIAPAQANGPLVIVGGGLSDDNDAVFAAFLDALPAPDAPIAIIPVASAAPAQSAAAFAANLERRGVAPERIRIIRLALEDDPETPEDESLWAGNAEADAEVMRFARVGGIWFTGGDQARVIKALVREDGGDDTAMLSIIRTRFAAGAVIGGTSAGAAIMSRTMIEQGDPLSLLPGEQEDRDPLITGRGLGFLRQGLVDQHFGERGRLVRLVAALGSIDGFDRIGFGIDEDTALVISPDQARTRVVGRGRVTFLDARYAPYREGDALDVRRVRLKVLEAGERADLPVPAVTTPVQSEDRTLPCPSAPFLASGYDSESSFVKDLSARIGHGQESLCIITGGQAGIALRFHRIIEKHDGRLMLDIIPMTVQLELKQR